MSKWKVERLTEVWTDEKKASCICSAYSSIYAEQIVKEHNAINDLIGNGEITVNIDKSKHSELMEKMSEKFSVYKPVILDQGDYETLKMATIDLIDSLDIGAMTYPGVEESVQKAKDAILDSTIKKRAKNAAEELIDILERRHGKMEEHVRDGEIAIVSSHIARHFTGELK